MPFLPGTQIEIVRDQRPQQPPQIALFDFDGTLSLIREGWMDVMVTMMVEVLRGIGTGESDDELNRVTTRFVTELTGKQTIYQMIRLAEEVRRRGRRPDEPLEYKHRYHSRLLRRIGRRRDGLAEGTICPEEMLVRGSLDALRRLRERGVVLYLASGTDEHYVREEAELLGLTPFFETRIYGARDDYTRFSKQLVIEQILRDSGVDGSRLLGFGDGYVEIDNVCRAGGTAVAVASDEAGRSGRPDRSKRDRLIGVGAAIVIPDFHELQPLLDYLWPAVDREPSRP